MLCRVYRVGRGLARVVFLFFTGRQHLYYYYVVLRPLPLKNYLNGLCLYRLENFPF